MNNLPQNWNVKFYVYIPILEVFKVNIEFYWKKRLNYFVVLTPQYAGFVDNELFLITKARSSRNPISTGVFIYNWKKMLNIWFTAVTNCFTCILFYFLHINPINLKKHKNQRTNTTNLNNNTTNQTIFTHK